MATDSIELLNLAKDKIEFGRQLQDRLSKFEEVQGVLRTVRNINREITFLEKVVSDQTIKKIHLKCSNLSYFALLVDTLEHQTGVVGVNVLVKSNQRNTGLRVDIICEGGKQWIKVIARNLKDTNSIKLETSGNCPRRIIRQAKEYVCFAEECLFMFQPPKVFFQFCYDIGTELQAILKDIGVDFSMTLRTGHKITKDCTDVLSDVKQLNIDITAMLSYISGLTNGSNCWKFVQPILNQQSEWERQYPAKPVLDHLFEGKSLICCKSALDSFEKIVSVVAGPNEKSRASEFIKRLEVFDDVDKIPDDLAALSRNKNITPRSVKIFAFGLAMKAVTITANQGFIRSANMMGLDIPAFIIQARALTESKEETAKKVEINGK